RHFSRSPGSITCTGSCRRSSGLAERTSFPCRSSTASGATADRTTACTIASGPASPTSWGSCGCRGAGGGPNENEESPNENARVLAGRGFRGAGSLLDAVLPAVVEERARRPERDPDRVLVLQRRGQSRPPRLRN